MMNFQDGVLQKNQKGFKPWKKKKARMEKEKVFAIKVERRPQSSVMLQEVLAENGKIIEARMGLHKRSKGKDQGRVILYTKGKEEELASFSRSLKKIKGIRVKSISL